MDWSAIIRAIMAVVGPLLKEWLARWLDDLLNRTAAKIGFPPGPVAATEAGVLLDAARRQLWVWQFAKRRLLAEMAASVPPVVATGSPLGTFERRKIETLALAC